MFQTFPNSAYQPCVMNIPFCGLEIDAAPSVALHCRLLSANFASTSGENWEPGDFIVVYRRVTGSLEDHPHCMVNDNGMSIWATATAIPPDLVEIEFPSLLGSLHRVLRAYRPETVVAEKFQP